MYLFGGRWLLFSSRAFSGDVVEADDLEKWCSDFSMTVGDSFPDGRNEQPSNPEEGSKTKGLHKYDAVHKEEECGRVIWNETAAHGKRQSH